MEVSAKLLSFNPIYLHTSQRLSEQQTIWECFYSLPVDDEQETQVTVCVCIYIYIYIYSKVKLATIVEGNPKAPFSIATTPMCRGGRYSFPGLLYFTLDPYLIMLSAKQGGIKYHFLSLWYDSTWDWTQVSRAIGEHSKYI